MRRWRVTERVRYAGRLEQLKYGTSGDWIKLVPSLCCCFLSSHCHIAFTRTTGPLRFLRNGFYPVVENQTMCFLAVFVTYSTLTSMFEIHAKC